MSVEQTVTPTPQLFPDGTAVHAVLKTSEEAQRIRGRKPISASKASGVISSGSVTLKGLEPLTDYILVGVVDELQKVTVKAKKGKFKLKFEGQETAPIKFDATAKEVQEALEALSNIAAGEVEVTGGPGDEEGTKPYVVKFLGTLSGKNVAAMTADVTELEEEPKTVTVSTTTQGSEETSGGTEIYELFRTGE